MKKQKIFIICSVVMLMPITATAYIWTTNKCITERCRLEKIERIDNEIKEKWSEVGGLFNNKVLLQESLSQEFSPLIQQHYDEINNEIHAEFHSRYDVCRSNYVYDVDSLMACNGDIYRRFGGALERQSDEIYSKQMHFKQEFSELKKESQNIKRIWAIMESPRELSDLRLIQDADAKFDQKFLSLTDEIGSINSKFQGDVGDNKSMLSYINNNLKKRIKEINILINSKKY
jgi:hypothetical protein